MQESLTILPDEVEEYLQQRNVMNLCTSGEDGPWASAVFFAHQGNHFYFMSSPNTTHGNHIGKQGIIAASVHEDYGEWQEIKGVQMRGTARPVHSPDEWKAGLRIYFRKYQFVEDFLKSDAPDDIAQKIQGIHLYCFEPSIILWLDNSQGFGLRTQVYPPET